MFPVGTGEVPDTPPSLQSVHPRECAVLNLRSRCRNCICPCPTSTLPFPSLRRARIVVSWRKAGRSPEGRSCEKYAEDARKRILRGANSGIHSSILCFLPLPLLSPLLGMAGMIELVISFRVGCSSLGGFSKGSTVATVLTLSFLEAHALVVHPSAVCINNALIMSS